MSNYAMSYSLGTPCSLRPRRIQEVLRFSTDMPELGGKVSSARLVVGESYMIKDNFKRIKVRPEDNPGLSEKMLRMAGKIAICSEVYRSARVGVFNGCGFHQDWVRKVSAKELKKELKRIGVERTVITGLDEKVSGFLYRWISSEYRVISKYGGNKGTFTPIKDEFSESYWDGKRKAGTGSCNITRDLGIVSVSRGVFDVLAAAQVQYSTCIGTYSPGSDNSYPCVFLVGKDKKGVVSALVPCHTGLNMIGLRGCGQFPELTSFDFAEGFSLLSKGGFDLVGIARVGAFSIHYHGGRGSELAFVYQYGSSTNRKFVISVGKDGISFEHYTNNSSDGNIYIVPFKVVEEKRTKTELKKSNVYAKRREIMG